MSRLPLFIRGLIIVICGIALAVGGCLGAFSFGNGIVANVSIIVAIAGVHGFAAGILMAAVATLEWLFRLIAGKRG